MPAASASLQISSLVPAESDICGSERYALYINNSGSSASNISVNLTMPEGFSYDLQSSEVTSPLGSYSQEPVAAGSFLNWTNSNWILDDDENLKIEFNLTAGCGTPSGNRLVAEIVSNEEPLNYQSASILVNQGLLKVTKEPNVVEAGKWDVVSWTINVENQGTGPACNVTVNDSPSLGLQLISITSGSLNWSYSKIDPGETESETAVFRVIGCKNLINEVNASWGCTEICQETYARSSVKFVPKDPDVNYVFDPSPIEVPYCNNTTVTVTLTNVGLGNATWICMHLSDLNTRYHISNVVGAIFCPNNNSFYLGDVPPGDTIPGGEEKEFSFDFGMLTGDCEAVNDQGTFSVQLTYYDDCGNKWYPPLSQVSYSMDPNTVPAISASKSGDQSLYLGQTGSYDLVVAYDSGNCDLHSLPENTITDIYPQSFEVVDPNGGSIDHANHSITWTDQDLNDTSAWSKTVLLKATTNSSVCNCGLVVNNLFEVNATQDCCGCPLNSSATLPIVVECFNHTVLKSSDKIALPLPQENCREINYTTTYIFNNTTGISWSDISFIEAGGNGQIFPGGSPTGNATFVINGTCLNQSSITLGVSKNLGFLETACGPLQDGDVLNVTYNLSQPEAGSFIDWSQLCVAGYDSDCAGVGCFQEGGEVTVNRADYSLSISGIDSIMAPCKSFHLTLNIDKNSPNDDPRWIAHNMSLLYNDSNYRYIGPSQFLDLVNESGTMTGFEPTRSGNNLSWFLGQNVTRGGTITFPVEKRCPTNIDATARLNYSDNCGEQVVRTATAAPSLLAFGNITIQKNPEVIYALDRNASWKIYVANTGSGTAYNVTVVDRLDSDLNYSDSNVTCLRNCPSVPGIYTIDVSSSDPCGPDRVIWGLGNLSPKQQMLIELNATLCGCENRDNEVYSTIGCGGAVCQNVSDSSRVELVSSQIFAAKHEAGRIDDCGSNAPFLIEIRNGGLVSAYNMTVRELLPAGIKLNDTPIVSGATLTSSDYGGNPLIWRFNQSEGLKPGTKILIKFNASVTGPCDFAGGVAAVTINYTEPCGWFGPQLVKTVPVSKFQPRLTISKTPSTIYADVGEIVLWTISINSVGDYIAKNVTLYDVLPENVFWHSDFPANSSGTGTALDPLVWNLGDMAVGSKKTVKLNATVAECKPVQHNNATVSWACCPQSATSRSYLVTRPDVGPSIDATVLANLNTCGGTITIRIRNDGANATMANITEVIPQGFVYEKNSAVITSTQPGRTFNPEPEDYSSINRTLIWNASSVDKIYSGEQITITFQVINCPNCCDEAHTSDNTVTVYFEDSCGSIYSESTSISVTPRRAVLSVRKEPEVQYLGSVSWNIYMDNSGDESAQNVSVVDVLGDGFTDVASSNGTITHDQPHPGWTTINWSSQVVPPGEGTWSAQVTAEATDICGFEHTNEVTVEGICDTGCIYTNDSARARALTIAFFHLKSLEDLLRGQTDLISSFESLLKNSTLNDEESEEFLASFDDLATRQQEALEGFDDVVVCNWRDLNQTEKVLLTDSFEDLLRRQAAILASNEDLLKRGFCQLDEEDRDLFLEHFESRIGYEKTLLTRFTHWVYSQQDLQESEITAWKKFLASLEDLIRRQSALVESYRQLSVFSCNQPYMELSKTVNESDAKAGEMLEYNITIEVNSTGLQRVENITINDSLLGVIQWPGITLNAGQSRSYIIERSHGCIDCNNCTCKVCNFAIACGEVVFDPEHNASVCLVSNQTCVRISQFGS
ncbi:MAG: hypothetical protein HPY61_02575 [Methanotrichaceae archaeon]|nr:hypothetical protein [Methanotrichaceae archaeon]